MKVNGQWVPCVHNSSYSLIQILLKLNRHCDHGLKICMWLGYTPQIYFCHFFRNLNLVIFRTFSHPSWGHSVLLTHFLVPILLRLNRCLDDASKVCMWFGYNPQVNF